ncbi:Inhibitor of growth protein [Aphelenchoides bicaudatus]|nr:Inhibitor of growth protein [Aphelenchoides bicaudatus]
MATPLSKFMKKLDTLPGSVRNSYDEIVDLDRRCIEKRKKLAKICFHLLQQQQISKAQSSSKSKKGGKEKGTNYEEAMELLSEMERLSTEKLQLASSCYEQVDRYIIELDKAYGKFAKNLTSGGGKSDKKSSKSSSASRKKKSRAHGAETDATVESMDFDSPLVEMPVDPNEPTYCVCHQVSFGQMICCDNKACVVEWFHFNCVGLTSTPKGKWYCDACKEKMGKRSRKDKK